MKKNLTILFLLLPIFLFSQDLNLWNSLNINMNGNYSINSFQLDNRYNFNEKNNMWLTRYTFKTSGEVNVGGGIVFKGNHKLLEFRMNQVIEYKYHRLLFEQVYFVQDEIVIPRLRYRLLPSFDISEKQYLSFGIEPIINFGSPNQYRLYLLWNKKIKYNSISLGYVPEFCDKNLNHIIILKYNLNKRVVN